MAKSKLPATQQKGQLIWRPSGWYGRYYAWADGERVRVTRALGTTIKAVARRKLARLIAENQTAPAEARRVETFEEAARRIVAAQAEGGMRTASWRLRRLEAYVFGALGPMDPATIRASHVRAVLEAARDAGKARDTLLHIKHDISAVLGDLWRAELIAENVTARVKAPEALPAVTLRSKKERAVLTDDELARYLAWEHPEESERMIVLERQVMACVARMFGGLRTSDLHALAWDGFDLPRVLDDGATVGGFETGIAPRRKGAGLAKGGRPQRLAVPEMLRAILRDWWERNGQPRSGLVFPTRRGRQPGEARKHSTHAAAFRRDLRRAFGIDALEEVQIVRRDGRPSTRLVWKEARALSERERELLEETEWTRPVDFHSWRRAFNQALADAGVNAQQAQALAGHSSMAAHERYLRNSGKLRELPEAALPRLTVGYSMVGSHPGSGAIGANQAAEAGAHLPEKTVASPSAMALQARLSCMLGCPRGRGRKSAVRRGKRPLRVLSASPRRRAFTYKGVDEWTDALTCW